MTRLYDSSARAVPSARAGSTEIDPTENRPRPTTAAHTPGEP